MICPCGGMTNGYWTLAGFVEKCKACGRRYVWEKKPKEIDCEGAKSNAK